MNPEQQYRDATIHTGDYLKTIAHSSALLDLSSLSLPEVDQLVDIIARVAPAGNVPGVVLNGLLRLPRRWPPLKDVRRDVRLLFQGVEQSLRDKAVYGTFFAGPAAVLWAYQNLLKLAGKDADAAFPEGTWQFYADYALRDDTARHTCETHGFDTILRQHQIELSQTDRMTAWVMAALHVLHQFDDLLANEWYERVATTMLQELTQDTPNAARFAGLYRAWEKQRPFTRTTDTDPRHNYPAFRRHQFDQFLALALSDLPTDLRVQWELQMRGKTENDLLRFQQQMSFLAYLEPDAYNEVRTPIPLENTHIGVIYQGRYYFIRACVADSEQPSRVTAVRAQIARILLQPSRAPSVQLTQLAATQRTSLPGLRGKFCDSLNTELDQVHMAPIWLNFDRQNPDQPLAQIRQGERAIGDHPLTIFDTGHTFIFDVSHIFCDGAWSVTLAEILTNEALAWGNYLSQLPATEPATQPAYSPLLQLSADEIRYIETAPRVTPEVSVETDAIDVQAILSLRKLFKQRSDLLQLTVNDLLLLYRAIHAASYQPHPTLIGQLRELMRHSETQTAVAAALAALEQNRNPPILIPVDASRRDPRQRVYPITIEVPIQELDLLNQHRQLLAALKNKGNFDALQRDYLANLAAFGTMMDKAKEIALAGESANVSTIKMLAHLPTPLQRLLDKIPGQFDILNDIIKGREVISNVGVVASDSTLTRFISAKDNNDKKTLVWGILTDAAGVMRVTLRDFRPHVAALTAVHHPRLATAIAQDYLDAYAHGLNQYVKELCEITTASKRKGGRGAGEQG